MQAFSVLGWGACAMDAAFRQGLPFPAVDINIQSIPALLRRRSSLATRLAFTAAHRACEQAGRSVSELPAVFASTAGEIQTTDQLCLEMSHAHGVVSPSAFHNSVQNTAAGYWNIAQNSYSPSTALAAGIDTFAMAMLEAWCQLLSQGGELLLVCYDETWPEILAAGKGTPAFASAWVLALGERPGSQALMSQPRPASGEFVKNWQALALQMPVLAAIPLLDCLAHSTQPEIVVLTPNSPGWEVEVRPQNNQTAKIYY